MQLVFLALLVGLVAQHNGVDIPVGVWIAFAIFATLKAVFIVVEAVNINKEKK